MKICQIRMMLPAVALLMAASILSADEMYSVKMAKARALREEGKVEEAAALYTELIERNHRDVDALVGRALSRMRTSDGFEGALADFRKAIVLSPGYVDAYAGAAACLRRLKQQDEVDALVEDAKKDIGNDSGKIESLADSMWSFGNWDAARKLSARYKDKLSLTQIEQQEYLKTLTEARRLRLDGFPDKAEQIYMDLLDVNKDDVDALAGLGFCKLRDKDGLDAALLYFNRVIELSPEYIDAYIGAAICFKRRHQLDLLQDVLDQCAKACAADESKMRYLAVTAWREGYFPLAREIDRYFHPLPDRDRLMAEPMDLSLGYAYSWLENQSDWEHVSASFSWYLRPDFRIGADADQWWRYGSDDFSVGIDALYRHDYRKSISYGFEFSDYGGFLAEQKHDLTARYRLYRGLYIYGGPRASRYDGDWSERLKAGFTVYWNALFLDSHYSFGEDTSNQNVEGYGVSAGFTRELRYGLTAAYGRADETVDYERGGETLFRSDDVESFSLRVQYYLTARTYISLGGLEEVRNSSLFRREASVSVSHSF